MTRLWRAATLVGGLLIGTTAFASNCNSIACLDNNLKQASHNAAENYAKCWQGDTAKQGCTAPVVGTATPLTEPNPALPSIQLPEQATHTDSNSGATIQQNQGTNQPPQQDLKGSGWF